MLSIEFALENIEEYDWMTLGDDEKIEWRSHPSILPSLKDIGFGIAISLASLILGVRFSELLVQQDPLLLLVPVIGFFGGIAIALYQYALVKSTFFVITNKKFVRKDNIFAIETQKIPTSKIQNKDYSQTVIQKILNIGDLSIMTAGTGGVETTMVNVPNPKEPYEYLEDGMQDTDGEDGV